MPLAEALGRRLHRAYGWLFAVLLLSWLVKLLVGSRGLRPLEQALGRAEIRFVRGWIVLCAVSILYLGLLVLALSTQGSRRATGRIGAPDPEEM